MIDIRQIAAQLDRINRLKKEDGEGWVIDTSERMNDMLISTYQELMWEYNIINNHI